MWRAFAVALVISLGGTAWADEPLSPIADAHLKRANELYDAGQYEQAIEELRRGLQIQPHSEFLYAWAQAERKRGNCREAVRLYNQFLERDITPQQREAAQTNIRRCPVEPMTSPKTTVEIDTPWYRDTIGNALTGGGALVAGFGGVWFYVSHRESERADLYKVKLDFDRFDEENRAARRDRAISIASLAVGGALITAGVVRYVRRDRRRVVEVTAFVRGDGGGLALAAGF